MAILLFLMGILIIVPSVVADSLPDGTQSGKTFCFLFMMSAVVGLLCLQAIATGAGSGSVHASMPDVALLLLAGYLIFNDRQQSVPVSMRSLEFLGLAVLYIALRRINRSFFPVLFMALLAGGMIQAAYGNLQIWGLCASHHDRFRLTGSFFNPGPYTGYLSCIFPVALGFYLFAVRPLKKTASKRLFTTVFIVPALMLILMILPASRSRAAWLAIILSSAYLLSVRYPVCERLFRKSASTFRRGLALAGVILLVGFGSFALYRMKQGSADGRLLVWKITARMITEQPLSGFGTDRFKAHYMNRQADYFEQHPDSEAAMVADDTKYAFNEPLQQTAEHGIIGLILMLSVFVMVMKTPRTSAICQEHEPYPTVAKAGMLSLFVFSLFSYPLQILPVKICLVFFLAVIAGASPQRNIIPPYGAHGKRRIFVMAAKTVIMIPVATGTIAGCNYLHRLHAAYGTWGEAYRSYRMGNSELSVQEYKQALPMLSGNGDFMTGYGKALAVAGLHGRAISVLQQAAEHFPNTVAYTTMGDSYRALQQIAPAEQSYLRAWYMNPGKFYPKYLLAKLYHENGMLAKAGIIAEELLHKKVKADSDAIMEIREEMQKIIDEYHHSENAVMKHQFW
jgi:hypothetical protein